MNCEFCGDGKTMAHAGPCVPVEDETVRWGVTVLIDGARRRMIDGGKPCAWKVKEDALREATREAMRSPERDPRIVKLRRKKKPRVTCKQVIYRRASASGDGVGAVKDWLTDPDRAGRSVRITMEELE